MKTASFTGKSASKSAPGSTATKNFLSQSFKLFAKCRVTFPDVQCTIATLWLVYVVDESLGLIGPCNVRTGSLPLKRTCGVTLRTRCLMQYTNPFPYVRTDCSNGVFERSNGVLERQMDAYMHGEGRPIINLI